MSLYIYDGEQETPDGYVGCRVVVSINNKVKQKWFNGEGHEKEATKLHNQWKMEQKLAQYQRNRERKERPSSRPYFTRVSGIKMKFLRNGTTTNKRSPCFIVSGSVNNQRFRKVFRISQGFDLAWFKACKACAECYGIHNFDHLLARKPDIRQFYIILKWQNSLGFDIGFERLPKELIDGVKAESEQRC